MTRQKKELIRQIRKIEEEIATDQFFSYSFAAPSGPNYGKSTSVDPVQTPDGGAAKNEDLSKDTALLPPSLLSPVVSRPNGYTPVYDAPFAVGTSPAFTAVTADLRNPDGSWVYCVSRAWV